MGLESKRLIGENAYDKGCVATIQGWTGSLRIWQTEEYTWSCPLSDMPLWVRQSMQAASHLLHWQEVPTPLYTKCTQSCQGAKVLYNTV